MSRVVSEVAAVRSSSHRSFLRWRVAALGLTLSATVATGCGGDGSPPDALSTPGGAGDRGASGGAMAGGGGADESGSGGIAGSETAGGAGGQSSTRSVTVYTTSAAGEK